MDYMKEMEEHWKRINKSGGGETFHPVICPGTWGRPCKLCDLAKEILFNKKAYPDTHPLRLKARELNRKNVYYSNIILTQSPFEIVIFEYGDKIFKRLLRFQMDPEFGDYKDFMHPVNGFNMIIDKIPAADKKQTDYNVEPRRASSALANAEAILKALQDPRYNLTDIVDNMLNGKVKVFNQKKLPNAKTEIRILPSWLGPKFMGKFFQHVLVHYNISQEDYDRCQAGAFNPFVNDTPQPLQQTPTKEVMPSERGGNSTWGDFYQKAEVATPQVKQSPLPNKAVIEEYKMPDTSYTTYGDGRMEQEAQLPDLTADGAASNPPICYGDYDASHPECVGECTKDGWGEPCRKGKEEKAARRAGARNLSPRKL